MSLRWILIALDYSASIKAAGRNVSAQLVNRHWTMKTVVVLAALVALALGKSPPHVHTHKVVTKPVDAAFAEKQLKVLSLLENVKQLNHGAEYYKFGSEWSIEANVDSYTNQQAVKEFLSLWKAGFLPRSEVFSIFYEKLREEAIALFRIFYYAKDFETFYKTAAWARVHLNSGQFLYAYYIAIVQRSDTQGIVLPAPYEIYPEFFTDLKVFTKLKFIKEQEGLHFPDIAKQYGLVKEDNKYVIYSNYSNSYVFNSEEQRLSYLTEDIGWNSYYYYFHTQLPFWWNGDKFKIFKERRGEFYYFIYKELLNRYYFERLTNGLGPIPEFSWYSPIATGYYPLMQYESYPFVQRPNYYNVHSEEHYENIRFLDSFEKSFLQFLENGRFKAFDQEIDFHNPETLNFVGNYWQYNADLLHENFTQVYQRSYEVTARHVLGGAPQPISHYTNMPSTLDFYQTSLRDPVFYQLYNRIIQYIIRFKNYLTPYTPNELHFNGVKINDVKVDKLVTYFDMYDFNVTNEVSFSPEQLKSYDYSFVVRQPRLNHKHFTVTVDVQSEVDKKAVFKVFLGPKYNNNGYPINIEENWSKFLLLDWFSHDLKSGKNEIVRKCDDFLLFKEDSLPVQQLIEILSEGKVPKDMSENYDYMPQRLMLPKGTRDGYPFQLFVVAYPYETVDTKYETFTWMIDNKHLSYPFDRPVKNSWSFVQPNMYFKEVSIYHEGELFPYQYNIPANFGNPHVNEIPK